LSKSFPQNIVEEIVIFT